MEIWPHIQNLRGRTLKTLERGNEFDVVRVGGRSVVVRPHASSIERSIEREAFEDAFQELAIRGELSRAEIQKTHSLFNPAYVASILAQIPGVSALRKPIRLFYRPPK